MVKFKNCNKCLKEKRIEDYHADNRNTDGRQGTCRECQNRDRTIRSRTKEGLASRIYSAQKESSIRRGHPLPVYKMQELKKWLLSQRKYHLLHEKWVESNYDKMKVPSCDRIDDYKPYSFDNIQLMTWQENKNKYHRDCKNGKNRKKSIPVYQYDLEGVFIKKFHSQCNAERLTNVPQVMISDCCSGKLKSARGFIWSKRKPWTPYK